ncbi:TetR family transcriptional regulator [Streptomyces sp. CWNU-1]|uniref:TetR family transcriptional regulator n=2 Tax=Streptomyces albipurpureus TaxID=2897419 RepID=A0ABT0UKR7_9ACTN|nr:TetR family transcriptional regulator [Streptomyces sp. CWNU-1]MCM2389224.1 TetR family transcriptional regulator [Streptomyces sp. CWNU-1]
MGLRERKKLKTRLAIRKETYRLIAEQGYEGTTVEQIAEAAEVSPSTVFRYFPVKEDIVLTDEYDPVLEKQLRARPIDEDPLDSIREVIGQGLAAAVAEEYDELVQRTRLMVGVPAVRARMTETMATTSGVLVRALADRADRPHDDLVVRAFVAAVLGTLREAMLYWAEGGHREDLTELTDRALLTLRSGLRR